MIICSLVAALAIKILSSRFAWTLVGVLVAIGLVVSLAACDPRGPYPVPDEPTPLRSGRQPAPVITIIEKT